MYSGTVKISKSRCHSRVAFLRGISRSSFSSTSKEIDLMAVKLNDRAFEFAKDLVEQGKFVFDERDMWSEHQPSTQDENEYIREHSFGEYAQWFLGIDTDEDEDNK